MRIKKFVLGAILAVSVMGAGTVNASAKSNVTVINVNSKSQVKTATAKVWNLYQEDKLFKVQGKYKKNVSNNIDKKIMSETGLKALPGMKGDAVTFGGNKEVSSNVKMYVSYLSKICNEINENTESRLLNPPAGASESQIKAEVLQEYMRAHCQYSTTDKSSQGDFKSLYEGNFKGVCQDGAEVTKLVGQAMGYEMKYACNSSINHGWAVMKVKESDGTMYWQGISSTAFGLSVKKLSDVSKIRYTKDFEYLSQIDDYTTHIYHPSYKIPY